MQNKESSQQTFKLEEENMRARQATIYDGKVSKRNNSDAQDTFQPIPGLSSCAVTST